MSDMAIARSLIAATLLVWGCSSYAADTNKCETHSEQEPSLCSYEPNTVGYTFDSDDVGFMDFKLSVRYQMFPDWMTRGLNFVKPDWGDNSALYFAFTGRFGQYIGTRDSSPVVGKRFNPELFMRFWMDEKHAEYVDFAFLAHESNGQSINDPAQYQQALTTAQQPEFANDQLSRGWDYLGLNWKNIPYDESNRTLSTYMSFKYFLSDGLLQGKAEEYNSWENNPEGKPRNQVNGISAMIKYYEKRGGEFLKDLKCAVLYETGYRRTFRYSTLRLELGTKVMQLPVTLWGQTGYGSDLAQYYKKVSSWGIQAEIGSF
jgi:outer membrane phospholipase A